MGCPAPWGTSHTARCLVALHPGGRPPPIMVAPGPLQHTVPSPRRGSPPLPPLSRAESHLPSQDLVLAHGVARRGRRLLDTHHPVLERGWRRRAVICPGDRAPEPLTGSPRLSRPSRTPLVPVTSPLPFAKIIAFESPTAEQNAESQRGEVTGPRAHSESVADGILSRVSRNLRQGSLQDAEVTSGLCAEAQKGPVGRGGRAARPREEGGAWFGVTEQSVRTGRFKGTGRAVEPAGVACQGGSWRHEHPPASPLALGCPDRARGPRGSPWRGRGRAATGLAGKWRAPALEQTKVLGVCFLLIKTKNKPCPTEVMGTQKRYVKRSGGHNRTQTTLHARRREPASAVGRGAPRDGRGSRRRVWKLARGHSARQEQLQHPAPEKTPVSLFVNASGSLLPEDEAPACPASTALLPSCPCRAKPWTPGAMPVGLGGFFFFLGSQ